MWMKTSLAALGMMGALAAATPVPTLAQGVHIGPGGVGIDVGRPGWRERHDRAYRGYAYERDRRPGCRTVTIERDDGSMKRIRRCD
jgi:hypothetical protein